MSQIHKLEQERDELQRRVREAEDKVKDSLRVLMLKNEIVTLRRLLRVSESRP